MQIKIGKYNSTITVEFQKKSNETTPIGFTGKKGEIVLSGNTLIVGTKGIKDSEDWRELGVKVTKKLKSLKVKTASIEVPEKCGEFIEGLQLGDYEFTKYKSKSEKSKLQTIYVSSKSNIKQTVNTSIAKAKATNHTRDWVNTTPEDAHIGTIEKAVEEMFKDTLVNVTVYGEKFLKKQGMNAHLAVNRASRHEAKTIKLEYTPKNHKEHHVFVGKGLTYDSGGLSIKPGNHMTTMKADKAGAMTVWGMMKYIAEYGSKSKVTVYMGIAENMIDGSAYKPDDVLTAMNGKTIHVKNTDAEGRLVLFDNLCLAQKQNKDITTIHTLATLTGAAVYQFGDETAGLVGFNDKLKKRVQKAGDKAGEIYMNAEFHKYMMDGVKDDIADLSNTGTPGMGCQKAGLFLTNAIDKKNTKKYVHWDIAGPAFVDKAWGHNPAGGSGFGVRTLINYVG
jgi:leucyl aminopeptidase